MLVPVDWSSIDVFYETETEKFFVNAEIGTKSIYFDEVERYVKS